MNPKVIIRTDGNPEIATGHIARCCTIAEELNKKGADVCFVVSDNDSAALICRFAPSYPVRIAGVSYRHPEEELSAGEETFESFYKAADMILVDSYFATTDWIAALRRISKVTIIDDLMRDDFPVDLVINYDIDPQISFYRHAGCILSGASYAPLRPQFAVAAESCKVRNEVRNILITTGGTDPYNVAGRLVLSLRSSVSAFKNKADQVGPACQAELSELTIHIVAGPLNSHVGELKTLAENSGSAADNTDGSHQCAVHVALHTDVTDMASLMASCDIAVTAGGTTLYELCAVGVPTLTFSMADNQLSDTYAFNEAGAAMYCGDMRPASGNPGITTGSDDETLSRLTKEVILLCAPEGRATRLASSKAMRSLTDGLGAGRIAGKIIEIIN
jgi:UDP-2,4-diacetamido-2,4,6-trideoxy-beta-L-altropyranose hydrolase